MLTVFLKLLCTMAVTAWYIKPHVSQTTFQSNTFQPNHMPAKLHVSLTTCQPISMSAKLHSSQITCQPNHIPAKLHVSQTTCQPISMSAKLHSSQTTCQSNHYKPHVSQTTCQPLKSDIKCGNFLLYYRELSTRVQGRWLTLERASHFSSSFLLTLYHMKMPLIWR